MKLMTYVLVALALLALGVFRFWPLDMAQFNMDPFDAKPLDKPNFFISIDQDGQFDVPADKLSAAFDRVIANAPRIKSVANGDFGTTYITRSRLMGYPDFISVKIVEISPTSAQIKLFARARFGYSDMGANEKRVKTLLDALHTELNG